MRRRLARFVVLSGSLVGILAAAPAALAQGAPPAPAVTVAKPVVRDVQETVTFTGRFDAAQSVTIKSRVAGYEEKNGQVTLTLENGEKHVGDGLIGCDGVNSVIRKFTANDEPSKYPGLKIGRAHV